MIEFFISGMFVYFALTALERRRPKVINRPPRRPYVDTTFMNAYSGTYPEYLTPSNVVETPYLDIPKQYRQVPGGGGTKSIHYGDDLSGLGRNRAF